MDRLTARPCTLRRTAETCIRPRSIPPQNPPKPFSNRPNGLLTFFPGKRLACIHSPIVRRYNCGCISSAKRGLGPDHVPASVPARWFELLCLVLPYGSIRLSWQLLFSRAGEDSARSGPVEIGYMLSTLCKGRPGLVCIWLYCFPYGISCPVEGQCWSEGSFTTAGKSGTLVPLSVTLVMSFGCVRLLGAGCVWEVVGRFRLVLAFQTGEGTCFFSSRLS